MSSLPALFADLHTELHAEIEHVRLSRIRPAITHLSAEGRSAVLENEIARYATQRFSFSTEAVAAVLAGMPAEGSERLAALERTAALFAVLAANGLADVFAPALAAS